MLRPQHAKAVIRLYEATQVELQGRYSLPRFREILIHGQQSPVARSMAVVLLTPLPGLFLLIFMDALPLNQPDAGINHQSVWVFFRVFFCGWIMAFMITMQICQSSPTLPMSTARLWCISIFVGLVTVAAMWIYGMVVGFPTPFVAQLLTPPWFTTFTICLWISWKAALRTDVEAKANLTRYSQVFLSQVSIIVVYTAYGISFRQVQGSLQTVVPLLLPGLKLLFKNWVSRGVYHMEDLAPSTIVFNVDVFHAMFVASTMQQSRTSSTTIFVMAVDIAQTCVAFGEIHTLLRRVNRLATACQKFDRSFDSKRKSLASLNTQRKSVASLNTQRKSVANVNPRRVSRIKLKLGVIDYAEHVLDTRSSIRDHSDVCKPRHLRNGVPNGLTPEPTPRTTGDHTPQIQQGGQARVIPVDSTVTAFNASPESPGLAPNEPNQPSTKSPRGATSPRNPKAKAEEIQLECVKCVLKMLHMIEFYVLIEFVEVVIAANYTIYMWVMSYLPNRQYYSHLEGKSHDEIMAMVSRLAVYTSLELVSFIVFCIVVDRRVRHISSIQILAFVLQKHMRMVQTTLMMWVFFVVQLTFEHFGTDYTFQFNWLRQPKTM